MTLDAKDVSGFHVQLMDEVTIYVGPAYGAVRMRGDGTVDIIQNGGGGVMVSFKLDELFKSVKDALRMKRSGQ